MKITYVHHSCFCVELKETVLVFDYFRGENIPESKFKGRLPVFDKTHSIYVFASHQHSDHYDPIILELVHQYEDITFVLSKVIRLSDRYLQGLGYEPSIKKHVVFMRKNDEQYIGNLKVTTLTSTDEGVAFIVECHGKTFYHAGDLHWWKWEQAEEEFDRHIESTFLQQMERLSKFHLQVAFVPIDPRLGKNTYLGIDYFLSHIEADLVFPMHFWQQYELIPSYKARVESLAIKEKIVEISMENQVFLLN